MDKYKGINPRIICVHKEKCCFSFLIFFLFHSLYLSFSLLGFDFCIVGRSFDVKPNTKQTIKRNRPKKELRMQCECVWVWENGCNLLLYNVLNNMCFTPEHCLEFRIIKQTRKKNVRPRQKKNPTPHNY